MNSSRLAQSIFFFTLVPLPVAALALLAVRRATSLLYVVQLGKAASLITLLRSLGWSARAEISILMLACGVSLVLALACWKYRPQVIDGLQAATGANGGNNEQQRALHMKEIASDSPIDSRDGVEVKPESQSESKLPPPLGTEVP